jgi:effector-binding domain-containing protein
MRILTKIILVLVVIVALAAIIGFFMPSTFRIERSMVMKAPAENIYAQVNDLKNWNNWMPWNKMDPNWKVNWGEKTVGEGASYSWESTNSNVGKGSLSIDKTIPGELVQTTLNFESMPPATGNFKFDKTGEGTKVIWSMEGPAGKNPFMKLMMPVMDKMVGKTFEEGLHSLDSSAMANLVQAVNFQIEMTTVQPFHYMAVRDNATEATIGQKLGMNYGLIGAAMQKQNLKMAGPVMAFYYTPPPNFEFDAAAHVDKPGKDDGKVKAGEIKGGKAVVAHYYGAYEKIPAAWAAIKQYIADNHKVKNGTPWEEYVTDPMMEKDTAKWLTNIYFPVE